MKFCYKIGWQRLKALRNVRYSSAADQYVLHGVKHVRPTTTICQVNWTWQIWREVFCGGYL